MSETSTPYTPASTSTTVAGNEMVSLADEIKKYKTKELIDFLRKEEDLELSETAIKILEKEEVNGRAKLRSYGMPGEPASNIAVFARECKEKKLRAFSSYLNLSEMLAEYGLDSDSINSIPLFSPPTYEIQDCNEILKRCMEEILGRCAPTELYSRIAWRLCVMSMS
jgi:hypothetical protein